MGKPDWDENANNMFAMRLQVIDRFVRAGSKCLMRMRVQRAADTLKEVLAKVDVTDRDACQKWIDAENKAAAAGGPAAKKTKSDQPVSGSATIKPSDGLTCMSQAEIDALFEDDVSADAVEVLRIPVDFVLPVQLPTCQQISSAEDRLPVEVPPLDNFEEFPRAKLVPRMDFKVQDYKIQHTLPPPSAYMRPNCGRLSRLSAVMEELSVRGPCGDYNDGAENAIAMPDSCLLPEAEEALSLLIPSPECRTYVGFPDFTECDPEYRLSQLPPTMPPFATEPLLPPDLKSLDTPWLAFWRPRRQVEDVFSIFDPLPCSFAEAGGSHGPRIGFDPGGERFNFLPVGGFARDLPSDTDDDDREDMENCDDTKPPPQEEFAAAQASLDCPLVSERWRKEREAETRLVKLANENNLATRERMRELNMDLTPMNKLYLG